MLRAVVKEVDRPERIDVTVWSRVDGDGLPAGDPEIFAATLASRSDGGSIVGWVGTITLGVDEARYLEVRSSWAGNPDCGPGREAAWAFSIKPAECHGMPATILGTPRADRIFGTPDADVIVGNGGSDRIIGRKGPDAICGNEGADHISGRSGPDKLDGGSGDDRLNGGRGDDRIRGGSGKDGCIGGAGQNELRACEH